MEVATTVKQTWDVPEEIRVRVAEALTPEVLRHSSAWEALAKRSDRTEIEIVDVVRSAMVYDGRTVDGIFNVYAYLNFDPPHEHENGEDEFFGSFTAELHPDGRVTFPRLLIRSPGVFGPRRDLP